MLLDSNYVEKSRNYEHCDPISNYSNYLHYSSFTENTKYYTIL